MNRVYSTMILGLVMYLLVEDTGNIHAQCLDIMSTIATLQKLRKGTKS
jgi:hypothetical protein